MPHSQRSKPQDLAAPAGGLLQPAARPVNIYYRPNLSRPELQTVSDFSPLSRTLEGIMVQQAQDERDEEIQRGASFAIENPQLAADINASTVGMSDEEARAALEAEFARAVNSGELPEAASPLFQIGFAQAAGRSMVGKYRRDVLARMGEATQVLNAEDGTVVEPVNIDSIMAEEWQNIAGSVALRNFYGRAAADGAKAAVDQELANTAARERGVNLSQGHRAMLTSDLFGRAMAMMEADTVTPEMLQDFSDFVAEDVHANSVKKPRDLVMNAIKSAAIETARTAGAGEAVRLIETFEQVEINGLALGEDAQHNVTLELLKRDYERQEKQDEADDRLERSRQVAIDLNDFTRQYMGALIEAADDPDVSLTALSQEIREQIKGSQQFGENQGFVLQELRNATLSLQRTTQSEREVVDSLEIGLANGTDIGGQLSAALAEGAITGADYRLYMDRNEERRGLTPFIDNYGPYQRAKGNMERARRLTGYSAEVQRQHDGVFNELVDTFEADYQEQVRATQGSPDRDRQLQDWLRKRSTEVTTALEERESLVREQKVTITDETRRLTERLIDATEVINRGFDNGSLTFEEKEGYLEDNAAAQKKRENLFLTRDYNNVLSGVDGALQDALAAGTIEETNIALRQNAAHDRVRDEAELWLDENLGDISPVQLPRRFRAELRAIQNKVIEDLTGVPVGAIKAATQGGESISETVETLSRIQEDLRLAQDWDAADMNDLVASSPLLIPFRSPLVAEKAYRDFAKFVSHDTGGLFGSPTNRDDVEYTFYQEAQAVLTNATVSEDRREAAVVDLYSLIGMRAEDVLRGQLIVSAPAFARDHLKLRIASAARLANRGGVAHLEAILNFRKVIDLKDVEIPAYTTPFFHSIADFEVFSEKRPADLEQLMRRLGIPDDDAAENEWALEQMSTISRVHPRQR